jgi:hypothetical protein
MYFDTYCGRWVMTPRGLVMFIRYTVKIVAMCFSETSEPSYWTWCHVTSYDLHRCCEQL